jgi:thioredoxin 1
VQQLTAGNWEVDVLQGKGLMVVHFFTPGCYACEKQMPFLEKIAAAHVGRLHVGLVNVDVEPDLAVRNGVNSVPRILLFMDGKLQRQLLGLQAEADLAAAIEGLLER